MAKKTTKSASKKAKKTSKKTPVKNENRQKSSGTKPLRNANGQYIKGQTGNPKGRGKDPANLTQFRTISRNIVTEIFGSINEMSLERLKELVKDKTLPALQLAAIHVAIRAIETGDHTKLNFLIEQSCGKLPETVNQNFNDNSKFISRISTERLKELAREALDANRPERVVSDSRTLEPERG